MPGVPADFRKRFTAGEQLLGTFIKTPTSHATEILGDLGFDFVVIDEEHAPFDRASIDVCLLAAKAAGTAGHRARRRADRIEYPLRARQRRDRRAGAACELGRQGEGDRVGLPLSRRQAWFCGLDARRPLHRRHDGAAHRGAGQDHHRHRDDRGPGGARRDRRHRGGRGARWLLHWPRRSHGRVPGAECRGAGGEERRRGHQQGGEERPASRSASWWAAPRRRSLSRRSARRPSSCRPIRAFCARRLRRR